MSERRTDGEIKSEDKKLSENWPWLCPLERSIVQRPVKGNSASSRTFYRPLWARARPPSQARWLSFHKNTPVDPQKKKTLIVSPTASAALTYDLYNSICLHETQGVGLGAIKYTCLQHPSPPAELLYSCQSSHRSPFGPANSSDKVEEGK